MTTDNLIFSCWLPEDFYRSTAIVEERRDVHIGKEVVDYVHHNAEISSPVKE